MRGRKSRSARGFTLIELMTVCAIIGVLATFAIPQFLRASAKAQRSEMLTQMEKIRQHFINVYRSNGAFPLSTGVNQNPPVAPPGVSLAWDTTVADWRDYQFPPTGGLRMRYSFTCTNGTDLVLTAQGAFPGIDAGGASTNYTYTETWFKDQRSSVTEIPAF